MDRGGRLMEESGKALSYSNDITVEWIGNMWVRTGRYVPDHIIWKDAEE